jgi:ankyrin repeat protein
MDSSTEPMIFREEYMPWVNDDDTPGMEPPDSYYQRESGIHNAVACNDFDKVKHIVSQNPDALHETDYRGENVLHEVARSDKYLQMALLLLDLGANLNEVSKWGNTPLDCAVFYGSIRMFEAFMERKAQYQMSPLILASIRGHDHLIKPIVDKGFNINDVDAHGHTALYYATEFHIAFRNAHLY